MAQELKAFTLRVTPKLFQKLEMAAALQGTSINTLCVGAVSDFVSRMSVNIPVTDMQERAGATLQNMAKRRMRK